ncbi:hypothetical protein BOX15_Mlig006405g1 [Macrostomum lignano]|uniref:Uncharacterized protein n=1 Tax=Macrostomum lignano TaxID=282301 RepID=A0A267DSV2_9PLAT|nr:hypothetical protein BOX15_Mlig006405g1 [Macrostomum lignano]
MQQVQQSAMMVSHNSQQQQPQLAQWQADRICTAAASGSPIALTAALTAVGVTVDVATSVDRSVDDAAYAANIVNCRDSVRCLTPLHCAATAAAAAAAGPESDQVDAGAGDCAASLLVLGANPNARDGHGCTPLHYAARYASPKVCQCLLTCRSTRIDLRNAWGRTALMFAAWGGDESGAVSGAGDSEIKRLVIARSLLRAGANVDIRDSRGRTALMWSALNAKVALLRLLLNSGADWRRRNFDGLTAAQLAQREGHVEVAQLLAAVADNALKSPSGVASAPAEGQDGAASKEGAPGTEAAGVNASTGTS